MLLSELFSSDGIFKEMIWRKKWTEGEQFVQHNVGEASGGLLIQ